MKIGGQEHSPKTGGFLAKTGGLESVDYIMIDAHVYAKYVSPHAVFKVIKYIIFCH